MAATTKKSKELYKVQEQLKKPQTGANTMMTSLEDLKKFIIWAKEQGLKEAHIGEHKFVFSEYELAKQVYEEAATNATEPKSKNVRAENLRQDLENNSEEDELKFWSSGT